MYIPDKLAKIGGLGAENENRYNGKKYGAD